MIMKKYYLAILLFGVSLQWVIGQSTKDSEEDDLVQSVESYETPMRPKDKNATADPNYYKKNAPRRDLDLNHWREITKNIDYSVERAQKTPPPKVAKKPRNWHFDPKMLGIWGEIAKWLFIMAAGCLLSFLVLKMIHAGNLFAPKSKKIVLNSASLRLDELEANLETVDIDPHLQKAIDNKEFTLAIRLYYLSILKELTLSNWIRWKKEKTNQHYLFELKENNHFAAFQQVTLIFERVWYGKSNFDETAFNSVQPAFKDFLFRLKK
jgi:hypothetical protein